jgi:uncharacterized protein
VGSDVKVAVVGAGISGMSAAWLLSRMHDVTLFEQEPRFGGHSNTIDVPEAQSNVAVDTGFIVYNTACYPNLIALFRYLDVPTAPTDMSFSVSLDDGRYEYNGNGARGFFAQWRNLASPAHWRMAKDIKRFFLEASELQAAAQDPSLTLRAWLEQRNYSRSFIDRHIVPMGAAIWSAPASEMLGFPAQSFARFFANHGLLQMDNRPQWRTVRGGSRGYVSRLMADFQGASFKGDGVVSIARKPGGVKITTRGGHTEAFDTCLIACHADDALGLLEDASDQESSILGAFRYASNDTILHTDASLMPRRRKVWTSWNYLGTSGESSDRSASVTYWMNQLQPLATKTNYFVSLNPAQPIARDKIIARFAYQHPMFDRAALTAQKHLWSLQGERNTWFAGSYFGYGFHEDGLQAGLAAAEDLGHVRRPWRVADESSRLTFPDRARASLPYGTDLQVVAQ